MLPPPIVREERIERVEPIDLGGDVRITFTLMLPGRWLACAHAGRGLERRLVVDRDGATPTAALNACVSALRGLHDAIGEALASVGASSCGHETEAP